MKKRVLIVAICILLAMSFASCGGGAKADEESEPTPSSSSDDVDVDNSYSDNSDNNDANSDEQYFDEETRVLTAKVYGTNAVVDIYIPEGCEYAGAEKFLLSGMGLEISEKDKGTLCSLGLASYSASAITMENFFKYGIRGENGHYVNYGDNEYFTNEGVPTKNGDLFYVIVDSNIDSYYCFTATSNPELKSKLDEVLAGLKFK